MVRLKDVGKIITGNTPKTSEKENYESNDICFVKPSDIESDGISYIEETENFIAECAREKARILPVNSVLVTCIGIIGKIGINKVECAFNQQINAIVPNEEICLAQYLAYAIKSKKFLLQDIANAPVVPILNKTQFADVEIKIVDLKEQESIVHKLAKVEALLGQRKQQLQKLDELVKARFVEMFGDISVENYSVLKDLCTIITDGTHQPPKFASDGIPFLFVSNVAENKITYETNKFITEETYNELIKRTPVEIGDVLLSTVGSYGHPAIVESNRKFCFQRHIAYLKPKRDFINSRYLHSALLFEEVQRQIDKKVKGIAQKTLNLSDIKMLRVPFPNIKQQDEFAGFVQEVDKSKLSVQKSLEKLEVLKKTLMQKYFG